MKHEEVLSPDNETKFQSSNLHRRKFLANLGLTAAAITTFTACSKTESSVNSVPNGSIDNASSEAMDIAILNYAFLLEQLEASFYIMVADNFYSGSTEMEKSRLREIRNHEIAHREFFKTALGSNAIPDLQFNFSSIDFSNRTSVLTASKTFEDTGVAAYNGIAYAIKSSDYLLAAGKIVSVEARHAAYIRDLLDPLAFADNTVIDSNGLDMAKRPVVILQAIAPFLGTTLDMKSFPVNL